MWQDTEAGCPSLTDSSITHSQLHFEDEIQKGEATCYRWQHTGSCAEPQPCLAWFQGLGTVCCGLQGATKGLTASPLAAHAGTHVCKPKGILHLTARKGYATQCRSSDKIQTIFTDNSIYYIDGHRMLLILPQFWCLQTNRYIEQINVISTWILVAISVYTNVLDESKTMRDTDFCWAMTRVTSLLSWGGWEH